MNERDPWWVVVAASVPGALGTLLMWWRWYVDARNLRITTIQKQVDDGRASLSVAQQQMFDSVRSENARLSTENLRYSARVREVEDDRDNGWDLARWWQDAALDGAGAFNRLCGELIVLQPKVLITIPPLIVLPLAIDAPLKDLKRGA